MQIGATDDVLVVEQGLIVVVLGLVLVVVLDGRALVDAFLDHIEDVLGFNARLIG